MGFGRARRTLCCQGTATPIRLAHWMGLAESQLNAATSYHVRFFYVRAKVILTAPCKISPFDKIYWELNNLLTDYLQVDGAKIITQVNLTFSFST